jgi:hypothetical protein
VITEIAGQPVLDKDDFRRKVAQAIPGRTVLKRFNGQPVEFKAAIRSGLTPSRNCAPTEPRPTESRIVEPGISVQELTDQHRRMYRAQGSGVIIVEVTRSALRLMRAYRSAM